MISLIVAAVLLLVEPQPRPWTTVTCPVAIVFGNEGDGLDRASHIKVQALLASKDFATIPVEGYAWGIEGEFTYCLHPGAKTADLIAAVQSIIEQAPQGRFAPPPPMVQVDAKVSGRIFTPAK